MRCSDGGCVPGAKCDRVFDCLDGSDEDACNHCAPSQFRCDNGDCIGNYLRCNGIPDCYDSSDERGCGTLYLKGIHDLKYKGGKFKSCENLTY